MLNRLIFLKLLKLWLPPSRTNFKGIIDEGFVLARHKSQEGLQNWNGLEENVLRLVFPFLTNILSITSKVHICISGNTPLVSRATDRLTWCRLMIALDDKYVSVRVGLPKPLSCPSRFSIIFDLIKYDSYLITGCSYPLTIAEVNKRAKMGQQNWQHYIFILKLIF